MLWRQSVWFRLSVLEMLLLVLMQHLLQPLRLQQPFHRLLVALFYPFCSLLSLALLKQASRRRLCMVLFLLLPTLVLLCLPSSP